MDFLFTDNLLLVPLEIRKDKKSHIVEDILLGEFYEMPDVCVEGIHLIQGQLELGKVEQVLKERFPHEDVQILEFAGQLFQLNLIKSINGNDILRNEKQKETNGFLSIPSKLGEFFFNRFSNWLYFVIFFVNILLLIIYPNLIPHYKDLFVFHFMAMNIIALFLLSSIIILIHEIGHILAMRAYGLPTKLRLGHRLFLIVLETDMSPAWKLPSKDRNVLYLAGISFDSVILFESLCVQIFLPNLSPFMLGVSRIIVFDVCIRLIYQCCIYMKTDLYFVFENATGCYNLMENAGELIRQKLPFFKSCRNETIYGEEKNVIFSYAIFYAIGVGLTVSLYLVYYIPQLLYAIKKALPGMFQPVSEYAFWDSMLFVLQLAISFGILFYSWSKKYRSARYV
ncbi:MAG: hypothetical protein Q8906_04200 [Bacillota bacterium]|nr:hypothetical protein [Bacillota bacterium]MDP4169789.1 hypothetical protein [Bacillota bacterium]